MWKELFCATTFKKLKRQLAHHLTGAVFQDPNTEPELQERFSICAIDVGGDCSDLRLLAAIASSTVGETSALLLMHVVGDVDGACCC